MSARNVWSLWVRCIAGSRSLCYEQWIRVIHWFGVKPSKSRECLDRNSQSLCQVRNRRSTARVLIDDVESGVKYNRLQTPWPIPGCYAPLMKYQKISTWALEELCFDFCSVQSSYYRVTDCKRSTHSAFSHREVITKIHTESHKIKTRFTQNLFIR